MTHFPGPDLGGGAIGLDETDPELLALPAPPRGLRMATLSMMAVVVAAAVSLALSLRADLAYFFGQNEVTSGAGAGNLLVQNNVWTSTDGASPPIAVIATRSVGSPG